MILSFSLSTLLWSTIRCGSVLVTMLKSMRVQVTMVARPLEEMLCLIPALTVSVSLTLFCCSILSSIVSMSRSLLFPSPITSISGKFTSFSFSFSSLSGILSVTLFFFDFSLASQTQQHQLLPSEAFP